MDAQEDDLTYNDLFVKFPEESNASISSAYETIEQLIIEAETYFQVSSQCRSHFSNGCSSVELAQISSSLGFGTERCLSAIGNEYSIVVRMLEGYQVEEFN